MPFDPAAPLWRDAIIAVRKLRTFALRALSGAAALVALFLLYAGSVGVSGGEPKATDVTRFAERFALTVLLVQLGLVVVLVPALVSDCIARDRESGTLDLVLATDLTGWEIAVGRFLGRLGPPAMAVLGLLPVLALVQLFGGVSMTRLVVGVGLIAASIIGIGGVSVVVSTVSVTARAAIIASGVFSGFIGVASCTFLVSLILNDAHPYWDCVPAYLYVAGPGVLSLIAAAFILRAPTRRAEAFPVVANIVAAPPADRLPLPPVTDDPLLWKELHLHCPLHYRGRVGTFGNLVYAAFGLSCGFAGLPLAGLIVFFHAAGSIAAERERDTLTVLRTLPGGDEAIVWAKWRAALVAPGFPLMAVMLVWSGFALLMHGYAFPFVLAAVVAVDGAFLATAGLTISLLCRTTRGANFAAGVAVAAMLFGPSVVVAVADAVVVVPLSDAVKGVVRYGGSPLLAWLVVIADGWFDPNVAVVAIGVHLIVAALLSLALGAVCVWLMRRGGTDGTLKR